MDPATAVAVLSKLITLGLAAKGALTSQGFDEKDIRALQTLLDTGTSLAGMRERPASTMAAKHLALVARAFGQAFGRHWHHSAQFVPKGGLGRFFSKDERERAAELEARTEAAALRIKQAGDRPAGKDELAIVDALTASPLETPYFRALWSAYADRDSYRVDAGPVEPPLLMSDTARREFERHFLLAYYELLAAGAGDSLAGYQDSLREYRARIVAEMLLQDMASWGARHVFGNVERRRREPTDPLPFLPLEEMYVEPDSVHTKDGTPEGASEPILRLVERLLGEEGEHVVVVKADFGSGKSLTARTLAARWAERFLKHRESPLDLPMPVFVRCADDFAGEGFDLGQTVRRAWKRQAADFDLVLKANDDAFKLPEGRQRIVVLLDGLDEVSLGARQLDNFFERLLEEATDRFQFVIFSRPGALPPNLLEKRGFSVVSLLPFQRAGGETVLAGAPPLTGAGGNQIKAWLERWNRVTGRPNPITMGALEERRLLDIAGTPILLLMIAHTWDFHGGAHLPPSLAEVYEDFFWHIARGKHEADRDRNKTVFDASDRLLEVLQRRGELGDSARAPDAMLWLMGRVAWEAHRLAQNTPPVALRTRHVDNMVEKELGIDDAEEVIRTIRIGLLLAMQADLETRADHILFGHRSFHEFLVARFWADRLRKIVQARARERGPYEAALLGGRLLSNDRKAFTFLIEMLNSEPSDRRPSSPVGFLRREREDLVAWCQEQFESEEQDFGEARSSALRGDRRAVLREAALAIGSSVRGSKGLKARGTTLRSMLAWFWASRVHAIVIAPKADFQGADLSGVRLDLADLRDANFGGAVLIDASLYRANCERAVFWGASMHGASLNGANLRRADLREASAPSASFESADLEAAKLERGQFIGANFDQANLESAFVARAALTRARLRGARLACANLSSADLSDANLYGAGLDRAIVTGATYTAATRWPKGFVFPSPGDEAEPCPEPAGSPSLDDEG